MQCACAILSSVTRLALQYFSTLSHKRHDNEYKMWILIFSTACVWNITHYTKKWARYRQTCTLDLMWSNRHSCPILMKLGSFATDCRKVLRCQVSWTSVQLEPSCSLRTNRRTDKTMLIVALRKFANATKMVTVCVFSNFDTFIMLGISSWKLHRH